MVNNNVSIDFIMDSEACIGVNIDLSKNTDKAIISFDVLLADKVKSICFYDINKKNRILVYKGRTNIQFGPQIVITLLESDIEIIRNLLLDVSIGQGFNGYHYDIEVFNTEPIDLCFTLK